MVSTIDRPYEPLTRTSGAVLAGAIVVVAAIVGVYPVIGTFIGLLLCAGTIRNERARTTCLVGAVLLIAGVLNSFKRIEGDWAWYSAHYAWLRSVDFLQYLGSRVGPLTIKRTEPVYYFISWALSRLTNANLTVLAVAITALIYIPATVVISRLSRPLAAYRFQRLAAEWVVLMMGITFTLTLHLVRQEVAGAFVMTAVMFLVLDRKWLAIAFACMAVLTHNSAAFPLTVIAFGWFAGRYTSVPRAFAALGSLLLGVAGGVSTLALGRFMGYDANGRSDGTVGIVVFMLDVILAGTFLLVGGRIPFLSRQQVSAITIVTTCYSGFLLGLAYEPLAFLRMYFFIEYLRLLFIAVLASYIFGGFRGLLFSEAGLCIAFLYFSLRALRSPFHFGDGIGDTLFMPIWNFF